MPVLNVRATAKSQPHISPSSISPTAPSWGLPLSPHLGNSLESEGAAIEFLGCAEPGFLGWGAAEQEELVGGVHELQLLPGEQRGSQQQSQQERGQTDRQTEIMHGRPALGPAQPGCGDSKFARRVLGIPVLSPSHSPCQTSPYIPCPDSCIFQARTPPRGIHPTSQTLPLPIPHLYMPHPASCSP